MPNIVQRLRDFRIWNTRQQHYESVPICMEAALEIESLKEQIEALNDVTDDNSARRFMSGPDWRRST